MKRRDLPGMPTQNLIEEEIEPLMSRPDGTGQDRIGRNVLTSWMSHAVFVVFGFVMPRVVDEKLGQELLGVWDFGWSIVSYLGLAMVGIGSSVNRYVARYRASGNDVELSETVSSVLALQVLIASAVAVATLLLAIFLPDLLSDKLGPHADVAGLMLLFLGWALAVQMAFDVYRGILTGCHEWSAYNALNARGYAASATAMLSVLLLGGGLPGMAITYFIFTCGIEVLRRRLALKSCPNVSFRLAHVNGGDMRKVFRFGLKTILIFLPRIIAQQTIMLLVVVKLGPAMLAVLARPIALVVHVVTLVNKFGYVLTPTAGSLQGARRDEELRSFSIHAMRAGWILSMLPLTFLLVLGDRVVELWMGNGYADHALIAILAAGSILPAAQSATLNIMAGLNQHGKIAKVNLYVSTLLVLIGFGIVSATGWTLTAAAWLIVLPSNFGLGLVATVVSCRVLHISPMEYLGGVIRDPLVLGLACGAALWLVRTYGPTGPAVSLLIGAACQAAIAAFLLRKDLKAVYAHLYKKVDEIRPTS
jgi:O-antigen/teichoic acid export membrane protein